MQIPSSRLSFGPSGDTAAVDRSGRSNCLGAAGGGVWEDNGGAGDGDEQPAVSGAVL